MGNNKWPDRIGSGVLVSNSHVLTNYHVIRNHRKKQPALQIRFSDGHRSTATVEFKDDIIDIALLKIDPHPLFQPMEFGEDIKYLENVYTYGYTYSVAKVYLRSSRLDISCNLGAKMLRLPTWSLRS